MRKLDATHLAQAGLNRHAVFDWDQLPPEMAAELRTRFDPSARYRQLILIGHAGKTLWASLKASGLASPHPIDDFSVRTVEDWFAGQFAGAEAGGREIAAGAQDAQDKMGALPHHAIIYPGEHPIGLQALGKLAGWHHPSPLMIGIDEYWGTWFAYRVVLLADSDLETTTPQHGTSPCTRCAERFCAAACPAGALAGEHFALEQCIAWRMRPASPCKATCLARLACPVGSEHRYEDAQIHHTYTRSMQAIEHYAESGRPHKTLISRTFYLHAPKP